MNLTPSEKEIFALKIKGMNNKEIATKLGHTITNGRPYALEKAVNNAMRRNKVINAMHMGYLIGRHLG